MTPTFHWMFCWVFLLALVGCTASVPKPLVVDACALLCNPGAETESERERDPVLFPRYPKVNCKLQSHSDEDQSWIITSHCLKLCNYEISITSEINCFAMLSSLQASLGCFCEALTPLSPNTMRLHESWRLNYLVKQLASEVLSTILSSPIDTSILCELHAELFKEQDIKTGRLVERCAQENLTTLASQPKKRSPEVEDEKTGERKKRSVNPENIDTFHKELPPQWDQPLEEVMMNEELRMDDDEPEIEEEEPRDEILHQMMSHKSLRDKVLKDDDNEHLVPEDDNQPSKYDKDMPEWKSVCKSLCQRKDGNKYCQCNNPHLKR